LCETYTPEQHPKTKCRDGMFEVDDAVAHNNSECNRLPPQFQTCRHHLPRKGPMMSDIVNQAVTVLNEKLAGADFDGTAKFDIEGEGAVMMDSTGARKGDEEADVTLSADAETFEAILSGDTNPTGAFMSGKLKIDGDMGMAMKLAAVLS